MVKYANKTVTTKAAYKSSNKKVATISKKGKITTKKNGTTTITIKYKSETKKVKLNVHTHTWKKHMVKEQKQLGVVVLRCGYLGGYFYYGSNTDPYISSGSESLIGEYTMP